MYQNEHEAFSARYVLFVFCVVVLSVRPILLSCAVLSEACRASRALHLFAYIHVYQHPYSRCQDYVYVPNEASYYKQLDKHVDAAGDAAKLPLVVLGEPGTERATGIR